MGGLYRCNIVIWGNVGIMEKKMETTTLHGFKPSGSTTDRVFGRLRLYYWFIRPPGSRTLDCCRSGLGGLGVGWWGSDSCVHF